MKFHISENDNLIDVGVDIIDNERVRSFHDEKALFLSRADSVRVSAGDIPDVHLAKYPCILL